MRSTSLRLGLFVSFALALGTCGGQAVPGGRRGGDKGSPDLSIVFEEVDAGGAEEDGGGIGEPNACGDFDPACQEQSKGPPGGMPFPLKSDPMKDPNASDDGVGRDPNGWLGLDSTQAAFDFLWIANTQDWSRGTVSKINSKTVREVGRYFSVTCHSLPGGSKLDCDGNAGCCSADDFLRWQARKNGQMQPRHQSVDLMANLPSRTAVDFNGDLFVANRAFGGQSSVTKVANENAGCRDRNKNGRIDTSSDVNGDGLIQTDCNDNGAPDDLDDVRGKPCTNGMKQEFYGLDDECVLWTTNTNMPRLYGRPLGLGPGAVDAGPSDAWAGTFNDGKFFRVDGTSGTTKAEVQLPQGCQPYGLAVDSSAYAWAPPLGGGPLCYFNTRKPAEVGTANPRGFSLSGYGIGLDRDQNVWVGGLGSSDAYRYTPDRTNGFANLDKGWWVRLQNNGRNGGAGSGTYGVAADSRTPNLYFVWIGVGNGITVRLPGSELNKMVQPKQDSTVDGSAFPTAKVAGSDTRGVGLDREQNVWVISNQNSVVTRVPVDKAGNIKQPDINAAPAGNNKCPGGDRCVLMDRNVTTYPYTYSDFTGFGLRNFTRPKGTYSYVFRGCLDGDGNPGDTRWVSVKWDAEVPPSTSLTMRARSGNTPTPSAPGMGWDPTPRNSASRRPI